MDGQQLRDLFELDLLGILSPMPIRSTVTDGFTKLHTSKALQS